MNFVTGGFCNRWILLLVDFVTGGLVLTGRLVLTGGLALTGGLSLLVNGWSVCIINQGSSYQLFQVYLLFLRVVSMVLFH